MWFMSKTKLGYHDKLDQVWFLINTKHDNDMTNRIENCQDLFALVWSLMKKTKQENDLIDHATVFYFKNDTKLS